MAAIPEAVLKTWREIVRVARQYQGSELWLYRVAKDEFDKNTNKCNKFVFDVLDEAGVAPLPYIIKTFLGMGYGRRPPTAGEWADKSRSFTAWAVVTDPAPGDVVAEAHEYADATGHVGIVVGARQTASASSREGGKIVVNYWGFRADNSPTFRRFVG